MGDSVVERVGPERRVGDGRGDGAVVHEPELLHHEELPVPAHAEVGYAHPAQILHVYPAEPAPKVLDSHHDLKVNFGWLNG